MDKTSNLINATSTDAEIITAEKKVDLAEFTEVPNENPTANDRDKGRKLIAKESTFALDEGEYRGKITDAFWYKTVDDKDRVMLVFELEDGTIFKNSVDGDWIEDYPFSKLISQANVEYIEDFIGLDVEFKIRNVAGTEITFSNIKQISLAR